MTGGVARVRSLVVIAFALVVTALLAGLLAGVFAVEPVVAQEEPDDRIEGFDEIHIEFAIGENGTAAVTVDYRFVLDDDNETDESWADLRDDVEADPEPYVAAERERWSETVDDAQNDTEREMAVENVSVGVDERSTPRAYGHVLFTFEWTGFAHVELNRIDAGDALDAFVLDDDTAIRFTWPEGYETREVVPTPDKASEGVVGWDGSETDFVEGEPRVELYRTDGEPVDDPGEGSPLPLPSLPVLGALVALAVAGGAVGWYVGRSVGGARSTADAADGTPGAAGPDGAGDRVVDPPPELLSNEERVLRLLEQRGGRLKQQDVVADLDWTEAKTSQVVTALREDDEIDVFRMGRENVLVLPDAGGGARTGASPGDADATDEADPDGRGGDGSDRSG